MPALKSASGAFPYNQRYPSSDFDLGDHEHDTDQGSPHFDADIHSTSISRKIVRTKILEHNKTDRIALVRAKLMAQKKARNEPWADADSFSLASLKAGQEVAIDLGPSQTMALFLALANQYEQTGHLSSILQSGGLDVASSRDSFFIKGKERETLEALINQEGEKLWSLLPSLHPDITKTIGLRSQYEDRAQQLDLFEQHLSANDWNERDWQRFFTDNLWIFGFSLLPQYLQIVTPQPNYGGIALNGAGGQRGDYLTRTHGAASYTVLVEIKRPETPLLSAKYRNGAYPIHEDLAGGIAQVQANCETWLSQGAQRKEVGGKLENDTIYTASPRGILIVGNTASLDRDTDKCMSFERVRRSLSNPEILTFDELLNRAREVIHLEVARLSEASSS